MNDPELVRAVRSGDVAAFTAIFDRHAARVHDLALAMLRDRSAALEVVESTFLEASLRLHALQEDHRLTVWLLSVTRRNGALRAGPTAGADRQPSLPNDDPEQARLAALVWEAVADLPLRERTLIDLDLRHGLDGQDLADALGVTLPQAQDLHRRMRDRIEKGLSGYLIARTAEGRCVGLTKVLKGWDGRFTPATSGRIATHVDGCSVCNQIRFGLPSALALYASALHAPFPAAVRPRVLDGLVLPAVAPRDGATPYLEPGYEATPHPQAAPPAYDATLYSEAAAPPAYDAISSPAAPATPLGYDTTPYPEASAYDAAPYAAAPPAYDATPSLEAAAPPAFDATPWLAEPAAAADEATAHPPAPGATAGPPHLEAPAPTDDGGPAPEAPATSQSQVNASPAEPDALADDDTPTPLAVTESAPTDTTAADADLAGTTQPASPGEPVWAPTATAPPSPPHVAVEPDDQRSAPTVEESA